MYKTTRNPSYKAMALTKKPFFTINVPQRQFMGPSVVFNNILEQKFIKMIETRFKQA